MMGGLLSFTAYQLLPSAGQVLYNAVYCPTQHIIGQIWGQFLQVM